MTEDSGFELPEHVVAKIAKVLGVSSAQLEGYDLVKLIEELCDTALMFDQEEREAGQTQQQEPQPAIAPSNPVSGN
jgi:hypothetical protein